MNRSLFVLLVVALALCSISCTKLKVAFYTASATAAAGNGNFEKVEELYKKVIALEPEVAEHHWSLASTYISMKEDSKVKKEIEILRKMGRNDLADQIFLLMNQPTE